jgi:hypothetical protein
MCAFFFAVVQGMRLLGVGGQRELEVQGKQVLENHGLLHHYPERERERQSIDIRTNTN